MTETHRDNEYRIREVYAVLDRRIEALEGRHRRRRGLVTMSLLAALAAFGLSTFGLSRLQHANFPGEVAPILETRAMVLRGPEGLERGALRVGADGTVSVTLSDQRARPRIRLSVLADGSPGVSLLDSDGDTRAVLGLLPDGTTTLVFADAGSVARTVLALTPDGASRIVFSDQFGETRTAVGVDGEGRPEVSTLVVVEGG